MRHSTKQLEKVGAGQIRAVVRRHDALRRLRTGHRPNGRAGARVLRSAVHLGLDGERARRRGLSRRGLQRCWPRLVRSSVRRIHRRLVRSTARRTARLAARARQDRPRRCVDGWLGDPNVPGIRDIRSVCGRSRSSIRLPATPRSRSANSERRWSAKCSGSTRPCRRCPTVRQAGDFLEPSRFPGCGRIAIASRMRSSRIWARAVVDAPRNVEHEHGHAVRVGGQDARPRAAPLGHVGQDGSVRTKHRRAVGDPGRRVSRDPRRGAFADSRAGAARRW